MRFMLNQVELGSNYLPLLLIVLKCARSSFQEKSSGFNKKEDFTSDFKEHLGFEEAPSTKKSKAEQNRARYGRTIGVHCCAPKENQDALARNMAWPPRAKQHGRAPVYSLAVLASTVVLLFKRDFFHSFGTTLDFFQSSFRV